MGHLWGEDCSVEIFHSMADLLTSSRCSDIIYKEPNAVQAQGGHSINTDT